MGVLSLTFGDSAPISALAVPQAPLTANIQAALSSRPDFNAVAMDSKGVARRITKQSCLRINSPVSGPPKVLSVAFPAGRIIALSLLLYVEIQ